MNRFTKELFLIILSSPSLKNIAQNFKPHVLAGSPYFHGFWFLYLMMLRVTTFDWGMATCLAIWDRPSTSHPTMKRVNASLGGIIVFKMHVRPTLGIMSIGHDYVLPNTTLLIFLVVFRGIDHKGKNYYHSNQDSLFIGSIHVAYCGVFNKATVDLESFDCDRFLQLETII